MIDWWSDETHLLLNERMPAEERKRLEELVGAIPQLPRHVWIATSGTTRSPRLVALSKKALLASAAGVNQFLESTIADSWCCVLPLFHVGGLGIYARAALMGVPVHRASWDPGAFATLCSEKHVTLASLVPAQLGDLLRLEIAAPPALRAVIVGGGEMSDELYAQAREHGWPVRPSYGMTEMASQIATARSHARELILLPHVEAREEEGRLAFRSEALLTGYAFYDDEGKPAFVDPKRDGWFECDDFGAIEGRVVRIEGRAADFVKIGGESVQLSRLDAILADVVSGKVDAALVGASDERLGTVIHLAVAAGDVTDIVPQFNERVLPFERIRQVHRVDALPRSALGKLLRSELAATLRLQRGTR